MKISKAQIKALRDIAANGKAMAFDWYRSNDWDCNYCRKQTLKCLLEKGLVALKPRKITRNYSAPCERWLVVTEKGFDAMYEYQDNG